MTARHLALVPPPGAAPSARRRGRSSALSLTDDEVRHLRAAIRGLARTRYASLAALARAVGVAPAILTRRKRPSPGLAVALARTTGVPVEVLLSGKLAVVPSPVPPGPLGPLPAPAFMLDGERVYVLVKRDPDGAA
jgi:hypothetical protein